MQIAFSCRLLKSANRKLIYSPRDEWRKVGKEKPEERGEENASQEDGAEIGCDVTVAVI